MLITIIGGTGALGSYFAYKLSKTEHNVSIIGRKNSQNLKQIAEVGLSVKTSNETDFIPRSSFQYVGAYNYSVFNITQDLLIVSLKQPNFNLRIAQQIMSLTDNHSIIGIISNGLPFYFLQSLNISNKTYIEAVDLQGEMSQTLQTRQIVTIIPIMGAHLESPGRVNITTVTHKIKVEIGSKNETIVEPITQVFNHANINAIPNYHINKAILEKLQFALSINVMSALLDQSNGDVFEAPVTQSYIRYVIKFVNNLAENLGIENLRKFEQFKQSNISKLHFSSMHQDFKTGNFPEVKVIISAPIELAHYFQENGSKTISTKPLEIVEELIIAKSHNISILQSQIEAIYRESTLLLEESLEILGDGNIQYN